MFILYCFSISTLFSLTNLLNTRTQPANLCHSRITIPIHTIRIPLQVSHRSLPHLFLFIIGRYTLLQSLKFGWSSSDTPFLAEEDKRMVQTCGEASRSSLQLHALPAHDTHIAELVHQPGIARNRCARVHVRLGYLLWRGTTIDCRHTSGQDIAKDEQL